MPRKKKGEKENFFVGINEPIELRKAVLEASKRIIHTRQKYEKFKEVRAEKAESMEKLKRLLNDISKLDLKLKTVLPKTKMRILKDIFETGLEKESVVKETVSKEETLNEFEKLDRELGDIETKLSRIEK